MDINKVKEHNDYTKALKKHKLMPSEEEAVKSTEELYGQKKLTEDDWKEDIEKQVRKLGFAVKRNQEKMSEIIMSLNKVISEIKNIKKSGKVTNKPSAENEEKIEIKGTKDTSKPIDRNKIAPDDVSVEKMFYFGKK